MCSVFPVFLNIFCLNHLLVKRIAISSIALALCLSFTAGAQNRVLGEVKKKISSLTLTADVYKGAITTLKPALTHDETKGQAETWYLQGKLQYGYFEKMMDAKSVGKKVDTKVMGHALIDGYGAFMKALPLDTVYETDKKGQPKIDKKTGLPKFKTKFSGEILNRVTSRRDDYNVAGGELYNAKDWDGAFQAWDIFCKIEGTKPVADSTIGQTRYFQALSLWQKGNIRDAVKYFAMARQLGYDKKETYDYALVCLSSLDDDAAIISLARDAYNRFGVNDPQYVRILINDYINNKHFDKANVMLDEVIAVNDSDAEIYNLKGLVIEQQKGMEQALPYYKKCIELNPENAQGLFNVGRYYYNEATTIPEKYPRLSGRRLSEKLNPLYREAMPYLEKAYKLDPSNEEAKNALRNIYYKLGEAKKLQQIEKQ